MPSILRMSGPRPAEAAPKIYLLSIHRYRHDETWHPVAAFGSHDEIVAWLEQRHAEYPHGYAIETVPFLSCEARGASCESRAKAAQLDPRSSQLAPNAFLTPYP